MGVDPGFGHPPGASSLMESMTPQPVDGWDEVAGRVVTKQISKTPAPKAAQRPASIIAKGADPLAQMDKFLKVFGIARGQGTVIVDKTGTPIPINQALFQNRSKPNDPKWKWEQEGNEDKAFRMDFALLLADTIKEPHEIWWRWEPMLGKAGKPTGRWKLKRRYLKLFEINGVKHGVLCAYEFDQQGWQSLTSFEIKDLAYFSRQRAGDLVYKSEDQP